MGTRTYPTLFSSQQIRTISRTVDHRRLSSARVDQIQIWNPEYEFIYRKAAEIMNLE